MTIDKWLTFDDTNKWLDIVKEKELNYYTDTFEPWQTKQKLKIGREVEWDTWWVKTLYFTFTAWTTLWVQSYTGFWFTPTGYVIDAWLLDTNTAPCISKWTRINWVNGGFTSYPSTYANISTRAIAIYNSSAWTNKTRANFSQFLSDGIELDFTDNALNIGFTITAFK